jgi:hypothetical protein
MFDEDLHDQLMLIVLINDNEDKNHDMSNEMDNQQHLYELFLIHHMHVIVQLHDEVQIFKLILYLKYFILKYLRKWSFFIIWFYTTTIMRFSGI